MVNKTCLLQGRNWGSEKHLTLLKVTAVPPCCSSLLGHRACQHMEGWGRISSVSCQRVMQSGIWWRREGRKGEGKKGSQTLMKDAQERGVACCTWRRCGWMVSWPKWAVPEVEGRVEAESCRWPVFALSHSWSFTAGWKCFSKHWWECSVETLRSNNMRLCFLTLKTMSLKKENFSGIFGRMWFISPLTLLAFFLFPPLPPPPPLNFTPPPPHPHFPCLLPDLSKGNQALHLVSHSSALDNLSFQPVWKSGNPLAWNLIIDISAAGRVIRPTISSWIQGRGNGWLHSLGLLFRYSALNGLNLIYLSSPWTRTTNRTENFSSHVMLTCLLSTALSVLWKRCMF